MLRLVRSLVKSIATAIRHDPEVVRLSAAHPRIWGFLSRRFDRSEPFGLRLTVGAAISIYCLYLFWGVAQDLISKDPLILADLRLMSVVQMFRAPSFDNAMLFVTYLGTWQIVVAGAALMSIGLALSRRWPWLVGLWVSIGGGEAIVWTLKNVFGRQRPDLVNALLPAQGPSFPSGHAFVAVSFYGFLACYAIYRARKFRVRTLILISALLSIIALGFSRIYLGVHWPSDVLASYALGGAWLAIVTTALSIAEARNASNASRPVTGLKPLVGGVLFLVWGSLVVAFYLTHPLPKQVPPSSSAANVIAGTNFPAGLFATVPRFSEDIVGAPMEPINVILVGSESDVARAFGDAGWSATDSITIGTAWHLVVADLGNQPYPQAPGTPSFWDGKPNQRGFEKPTASNSARERHHLHLWDTHFSVADAPVWVGTVHLDTSAKTASGVRLPIHQIDPAIDLEREALRADLSGSTCVRKIAEEPVTNPMVGKNGVGNPFFTDGKTLIVSLKCG